MLLPESGEDGTGGTMVVGENILSSSTRHVARLPQNPSEQSDDRGPDNGYPTSRPAATQAGRLLDYWEIRHESFEISKTAKTLVEASWRGSTEKRYSGAWQQWLEWCGLQRVQAALSTLANILDYLASLFDKGCEYRTINLHRSALSSTLAPIDGFCVGQHPTVCRLLKGAYNLRPPRQKLCPTWSVQVVLDTLRDWSPASKLDLRLLTFKTNG